MGLGALALGTQLTDETRGAQNPTSPRSPHFPGKARRVIHIFANGGPSHVDTFDPKPALARYAGQSLPTGNLQTERKTGAAMPSPFPFQRYGKSGLEISSLFERTARHADDLCVIRSMHAELPNHEPSLMLMNCGDGLMVRPSFGSWVTYGLGSENQNLPSFVVLCPGGLPVKESENWQAAFLPGVHAGTFVDTERTRIDELIENIQNPRLSHEAQRRQLDLAQALNAEHLRVRGGLEGEATADLEARIHSFEMAYRMQMEAAEAFDVAREPRHVLERYGPGVHSRQLLIARRLLERGVRFVQVWHGAGQPWDNHSKLEKEHRKLAGETDQPIAALLQDLKERGMLDSTLVIWGGEFGRTPTVELELSGAPTAGRDHNPYGFSMWLAGGGVRGGHVHGATDEFGFKAVDRPVSVHDLHATLLHLLGFDHTRLTYRYAGRDFRLTDVYGTVVRGLLA